MLTYIKRFFFYDLSHLTLVPAWLALTGGRVTPFFLQKRLVLCCATLLRYDEIRGGGCLWVNRWYLELVGVFTNVLKELAPVVIFVGPFSYVVMCFLLL